MATGGLKDAPEVITVSDANTQFGLELFGKCGADRKDENLFLAPFSISTALAMTQLGAGGATAAEMAKALKWPSQDRPLKGFGSYLSLMSSAAEARKGNSYILSGAQRIFVRQSLTLKQQFNSDAQQYFGADAKTADFQSNAETERKNINTWVSEKTQGKIKDLLPAGSLDSLTAMVLVQATYFKGFWLDKFDPRRTVKSYFKGTKGKVEVDMMSQQAKFPYAQCEWLSCSAIELPYARGDGSDRYDLSMLILLPDEDDGLAALEASLTASDLAKLRSSMTTSGKVNLKLPRFSMESSLKLKEVLISLGMVSAFSEKHADFTGLVEQLSEDLYLSEVYHKAFVEVNEEGSEAAAATGAAIKKRSMCISRNLFVVDHPFLIFIIDRRADIVLFMGRLVNPAHSERAGNQEL
ncbi:LOW QUALITY PROTEIN: leukocyte elastase inhibitor-like [Pomacea canaliculata]|nr:LOW QUALITY PROTEIN: leukocyte elastase inhibitor-like [Pomacea canaliculata]